MRTRQKFVKRSSQFVVAVQLDLLTNGFTYQKWGSVQSCKPGDWIVNNNGDTYTINRDVFLATYKATAPGQYVKTTPVWAEVATNSGEVHTKQGSTHYEPGDYLVYNASDSEDGYAVPKTTFERMYELSNDPSG